MIRILKDQNSPRNDPVLNSSEKATTTNQCITPNPCRRRAENIHTRVNPQRIACITRGTCCCSTENGNAVVCFNNFVTGSLLVNECSAKAAYPARERRVSQDTWVRHNKGETRVFYHEILMLHCPDCQGQELLWLHEVN